MTHIRENSSREELLQELQRIRSEASSLKDIINSSPAIAFSWKMAPGWPVDFVSDNISTLGYTPDDFYSGKVQILDIAHPDERAEIMKQSLHKAFTLKRREFRLEYRVVRRDGSFIWVDARILVVRGNRGRITGFQGLLLNITEQKEAREREFSARVILRTVIDNLPQLVFWKDLHSTYLGCNQAFAKDANLEFPHQITGKNDLDLGFSEKEAHLSHQLDRHITESDPAVIEYLYEDQRDERKGNILKVSKMPLYDVSGEVIGIVGTAEDITEKIRNEQAIAESEARYRHLVNSADDAIFLHGLDEKGQLTCYLDVNEAACSRYGYSREEFMQMSPWDLTPPELQNENESNELNRLLRKNSKHVFEFTHLAKGGKRIPVEINVTSFILNERTYYTSITRDISKRKQTERELADHRDHLEKLVKARTLELTQAKERVEKVNRAMTKQWDFLRAVIEHTPALIYVKDTRSRFIIANQATIEQMGVSSEEELKGKTDYDFYPQKNADQFALADKALLDQKLEIVEQEEHIPFMRTGEKRWFYTTKLPLRNKDDKIIGLIGIGYDITQRKQAERERELLIAKAESASKAKSAFLANMSHEIRTPLNGVIGMTSLLLDTKLDETQQHYVGTLRKSGEFLLAIINDILDLSKIEAGKLELSLIPFSLKELFRNIADIALSKVTKDKVELHSNPSPQIPEQMVGDPDRLKQILLNLVSNALKFTEEGAVCVTAHVEEEREEEILLRFTVTDTGIGISDNKKKLLFKNFSQLDDSTTRKYGGTGLGLTISKQLCELMGGTIGVNSSEGVGSEFWFTACFQKCALRHGEIAEHTTAKNDPSVFIEAATPALVPADQNPTIANDSDNPAPLLIAEDNPINQQVMAGILGKLGFSQIEMAQNGLEVLQKLENKRFQLILMDLSMPMMDGLTTTEKIRSQTFSCNANTLPIVALTAHAIKGDREMCLESGMNDYLTKPVNPQELKRILDKWLRDPPPINESETEFSDKSTDTRPQQFDYETMLDRLMGDTQLAEHIIRLFLDETPPQLATLGQLLDDHNIREAGYLAHKLMGAAANVDVNLFYATSRRIEEECFHGTESNLDSLHKQLVEQFELARLEMLQFITHE